MKSKHLAMLIMSAIILAALVGTSVDPEFMASLIGVYP